MLKTPSKHDYLPEHFLYTPAPDQSEADAADVQAALDEIARVMDGGC